MTIEEILDKIVAVKVEIKTNPDAKKILFEMKSTLDEKISEEPLEKVIFEIENWLAKNPDEKHVEMKLKKLKEKIFSRHLPLDQI